MCVRNIKSIQMCECEIIYIIQNNPMAGEKHLVQGKKRCQQKCGEHQFYILPKNPSRCWLKQETKVDFCPVYNEACSRYDNIVPIFNHDEQSCLPGFILEIDKNDYQQSMKKYKDDHERKITEYTIKKKQLQIPKPGRKHSYCGVCRKSYNDYLQHIQSHEHIKCFNQHDFVKVITKIMNDDYKCKKGQESTTNNDSSTYPSKINQPEQGPKKRGRKPKNADPSTKKTTKTQSKRNQKVAQSNQQAILELPPPAQPVGLTAYQFPKPHSMVYYPQLYQFPHICYPFLPHPAVIDDRMSYKQMKPEYMMEERRREQEPQAQVNNVSP